MLSLRNQTISVLGAGRSGRAAAALAERLGGEVTLYDSREVEGAVQVTLEEAAQVRSDLVVLSPGIPPESNFVQAFLKQGGVLWGEVELASRVYQGTVLGITGTNGKTTTTELAVLLFRAAGKSCLPCGNYGVPFSEVVLMEEVPETVALELSSFQLETAVQLKPDAVIWLNFSPDHMDRYRSLADYRAAKLRIFNQVGRGTPAVVRRGEDLEGMKGDIILFDAESGPLNSQILQDHPEVQLRGRHNLENLAAAFATVSRLTGLSREQAVEALSGYEPPEHRCQFVRHLDGVDYINDSKATNLHALKSALQAFDQRIILIAGGKEKGLEYQELIKYMKEKVTSAIFFGEIGASLKVTFEGATDCHLCEELTEAVLLARRLAKAGDLVLFSPGTSSFDQFTSYQQRGAAFQEAVAALPG